MGSLGDKIKGTTNETVGKVTGNKEQETKGKLQNLSGDAKEKFENKKDDLHDSLNEKLDEAREDDDENA